MYGRSLRLNCTFRLKLENVIAYCSAFHLKIIGDLKIDCAGLTMRTMAIELGRLMTYFCFVFVWYI
jgi:hypothetical protein